jgi:guanine deaminase
MPGFVDCHIHAPQMPNIGLGLDKTLLDWLDAYTFPLESEYKDVKYAQHVYSNVVRDTLKFGTTCACYFATIHKESCKILVEEVARQGQRALVGKVSMTQYSPDFYV